LLRRDIFFHFACRTDHYKTVDFEVVSDEIVIEYCVVKIFLYVKEYRRIVVLKYAFIMRQPTNYSKVAKKLRYYWYKQRKSIIREMKSAHSQKNEDISNQIIMKMKVQKR